MGGILSKNVGWKHLEVPWSRVKLSSLQAVRPFQVVFLFLVRCFLCSGAGS